MKDRSHQALHLLALDPCRKPLRQHRSVAQEVTHLLSDALETPKPLSILALKGLGKEHWRS
jgi:hypothetical protein